MTFTSGWFVPLLTPGELLPGLALALAIGLPIGIRRRWRLRDEEPGGRVAGIRTFSLLGLLGGPVGPELAAPVGIVTILIAIGAVAALLLHYSSLTFLLALTVAVISLASAWTEGSRGPG